MNLVALAGVPVVHLAFAVNGVDGGEHVGISFARVHRVAHHVLRPTAVLQREQRELRKSLLMTNKARTY